MQCKHFGVCGGCTLPGVAYAQQLEKKRRDLSRLLRLEVPPLVPSPAEAGFRSKVAFVFGHTPQSPGPRARGSSAGRLVMGHYAIGSQRIIPIDVFPHAIEVPKRSVSSAYAG